PEFAAQVAEECQRLLAILNKKALQSMALWKLEGYTNREIADRLGCVPRTVERKVQAIRRLWSADPGCASGPPGILFSTCHISPDFRGTSARDRIDELAFGRSVRQAH